MLGCTREPVVWVDGCFSVAAGRCLPGPVIKSELGPSQLRLWLPGVGAEGVTVEGAEVRARAEVDGGARLELELREGATRLVVTPAERGFSAWSLPLRAWPAVLREAAELPLTQGVAWVDGRLAELPTLDRAIALRVTGNWLMQEAVQDAEALADRLSRVVEAQREAGSVRDAQMSAMMRHYVEEHYLGAAGPGEVEPLLADERWHDVTYLSSWSWASLRAARWEGRFSDALVEIDRLKELDRRVIGGDFTTFYAGQEGEVLELLGDHEASVEAHAALVPAVVDCVSWPLAARNHALAMQRARERGVARYEGAQVRALLERVLGCVAAGEGPEADPSTQADLLADLARVAVFDGQYDRAAARLAAFDALAAHDASVVRHGTWLDRALAGARLAHAQGRFQDALAEADRGLARVDAWEWPIVQLELNVLRAEVLERVGQRQDAAFAYHELHQGWVSQGPLVPMQRGRAGFLSVAASALPPYVDLLVADGRAREAVDALREARFQLLAGLQPVPALLQGDTAEGSDTASWSVLRDEVAELVARRERTRRAYWESPLDARSALRAELDRADEAVRFVIDEALGPLAPHYAGGRRAPEAGELMLTWVDQGVRRKVFALSSRGLLVRDGRGDDPELVATVLREVLSSSEPPERITVLPGPGDESTAVHLTPFRGAPVVASVPVAWSMDLPEASPRERDAGAPLRALVVGDPRRDLEAARVEAEAVAERLGEAGWQVELLLGRQATREAVLAALPNVDLLHFAGHGAFAGSRRAPWDARLLLADQRDLGVLDVLLLPVVPAWVVLSGCDTARSTDLDVTDLGLAQAFLTRGAASVFGATDEVDSAVAARVALAFVGGLAAHGDPRRAFQDTVVRADAPPGDRSTLPFRLMVP